MLSNPVTLCFTEAAARCCPSTSVRAAAPRDASRVPSFLWLAWGNNRLALVGIHYLGALHQSGDLASTWPWC